MSEIKTQPKRLIDLNPSWLRDDLYDAVVGLRFDCPCGAQKRDQPDSPFHGWPMCEGGRLLIPFEGDHAWQRSGDSFDNLTLTPSLHLPGHWHGWLQNGMATSC